MRKDDVLKNDDFTSFYQAMLNKDITTVKFLVASGANVNAKNHFDDTPLLVATQSNQDINMVKILVNGGANVNARNKHGITPLRWAVYHQNCEVAKLLVSEGANINAKDHDGLTPLSLAGEHDELVRILVSNESSHKEIDDANHKTCIESNNEEIHKQEI